jgi:hypothetical protein
MAVLLSGGSGIVLAMPQSAEVKTGSNATCK